MCCRTAFSLDETGSLVLLTVSTRTPIFEVAWGEAVRGTLVQYGIESDRISPWGVWMIGQRFVAERLALIRASASQPSSETTYSIPCRFIQLS